MATVFSTYSTNYVSDQHFYTVRIFYLAGLYLLVIGYMTGDTTQLFLENIVGAITILDPSYDTKTLAELSPYKAFEELYDLW